MSEEDFATLRRWCRWARERSEAAIARGTAPSPDYPAITPDGIILDPESLLEAVKEIELLYSQHQGYRNQVRRERQAHGETRVQLEAVRNLLVAPLVAGDGRKETHEQEDGKDRGAGGGG